MAERKAFFRNPRKIAALAFCLFALAVGTWASRIFWEQYAIFAMLITVFCFFCAPLFWTNIYATIFSFLIVVPLILGGAFWLY